MPVSAKDFTGEPLREDDAERINTYAVRVSDAFDTEFTDTGDRFKDSQRLLQRFSKAVDGVLATGWSEFHAVDEAHNEMCIARAVLSSTDPVFSRLEYEPPLAGYAKSIDYRATNGEVTVYVDVKTIAPKPTDRWDQFVSFEEEGRFPERVEVFLDEDWLGGELWHNMYASRARMLEHALGLETKISEGKLAAKDTFFVLALCGYEYHWRQSHLEDFVFFYRFGCHGPGDPFSKAETKYIEDKHLLIGRTISRFASMFRPQGGIFPNRLKWNVGPTKYPSYK